VANRPPHDEDDEDNFHVVNNVNSARDVVQAGVIFGDVHLHSIQAPGPRPVARPISAWTMRELGVHRSIVVEGKEQVGPTRYVARRHDDEVRELLRECGSRGRMVVLVGGAAVGKTRTAYEALLASDEVRSWPVIVPAGPAQLCALLAEGVPARHVLWLNDMGRRFLDSARGLQVAEGLIGVLQDRQPLLILADLSKSHPTVLGEGASPTSETPSGSVLHLMNDLSEKVWVPDDFTDASDTEKAHLRDCAREDERLALAMRLAHADQKIIQVLTGGPQLMKRYTRGLYNVETRALIVAAVDLVRLGCRGPVDLEVLRCAAEKYLEVSQKMLSDGWPIGAFEEAAREYHGIAALTPVRMAPGVGAADGCNLHDYLLHEIPPARERQHHEVDLWAVLAERPPGADDQGRLAVTAVSRGLYRLAALFALPAAEADDPSAVKILAALCDARGDLDQARVWRSRVNQHTTAGQTILGDVFTRINTMRAASDRTADPADQVVSAANALIGEREYDEAEALLRPHVKAKHLAARQTLAALLKHRDGNTAERIVLLRELADLGDPIALTQLVGYLADNGADHQVERLLGLHAGHEGDRPGDPSAMWALAEWLVRRNRVPEAINWFSLSARRGEMGAALLVKRFGELGCLEAAESPLKDRAGKGSRWAREQLAELLGMLGRHDEAAAELLDLLKDDEHFLPGFVSLPATMAHLVDALRQAGRVEEADRAGVYGIMPDNTVAEPWPLPLTR